MAQQYGRWTIKENVGKGGQAETFLVCDKDLPEKNYVMKRLKDRNRLDRFEREVKVCFNLAHPNIIKVVDKDLEHKHPYFVSEYYGGGSLTFDKIAGRSFIEKLKMFSTVCRAVGHAHKLDIFHRDLKPDNIFLRDDMITPIVGDFGICFLVDEEERLTSVDRVMGSRWFTAPELAHGMAEDITASADVYSLGKLLYWMLSGTIFDREIHRQPKFNLTKANPYARYFMIYDLLDRMIVEAPSKRIPNASDVADEVDLIILRIEMNAHHIDIRSPQACMYCGVGTYRITINGSDLNTDVQRRMHDIGINFATRGHAWLIIVCDYCGHLQMFRPDFAKDKNIWNKEGASS